MTFFLSVLTILICIAAIFGVIIYFRSRTLLREQKNYERGLKMVPLLIHMAPASEDTEVGSRDARDVVEENISKAQTLYSIIASTLRKGFRTKFYGQRHFAFEIIGRKGLVEFYTAVPVSMVDVVKQAIVSAYPSSQLEEVAEHNIFSPVGGIGGTLGGELTLKEHYAFPIATYQEIKRDTMQSLLNSLSTLDKEDGAGIQILMRPAESTWRKNAQAEASKKRKGKDAKNGQLSGWARQLALAPVKPPETKDGEKDKKPELSNLDQAVIDSIEDKTRYPGYEVLIRLVASSDSVGKAQAVLNNMVATFSLFESQGRNGFSYTPAKDIESFVTAFILRFFPQEDHDNILNSVELATLFHFPDQKNVPTSQLERQASKQVDGPRNISEEGLLLGYNVFRGAQKPIRISEEDRRRHIYVVGQTGTGKSTFMENLILQDMLAGRGFAFIDPHGDAAERILAMVPKERTEDVVYFCPADMDYPMGLNLFEFDSPDQKDFLIQEAINMLYKLYDPQHQGIIGPRYEHWFRNAALTVMANPEGGTFIDIPKVFTDKQYERHLKQYVTDQTVLDFWNKEMAQTADFHKSEVLGWFVSKFGAFLSNAMMRNIIGQQKSSFNLRQIMDEGKILLVNLSKGRSGELNSKLLGMVFVMKFQAAAMSRANVHESERRDFTLYVDEFQNFSTESFADILSEARKYGLSLTVANQFTTQLSDEIRDAVFGNVGTIVSFRVGTNDAEFLSKQFTPIFDSEDLQRLPNHNTVARMLISGVPAQPFSMTTIPPLGTPNRQLSQALKQLSAAKFGRPKAAVEAEIFKRLATKEEPKPAFSASNAAYSPAGAPRTDNARGTGSSFLDEWLSKRQSSPAGAVSRPAAPLGPKLGPKAPTGPQKAPFSDSMNVASHTIPANSVNSLAPSPKPTPSSNITGTESENKEISGVADKLRQGLTSDQPKPSATQPSSPQGEVDLSRTHSVDEVEDTIYIDQEGNLKNAD